MIVDSQVHIWGADTPRRPWPPGGAAAAHSAVPVSPQQTLRVLDEAGVRRAVAVPPSWEGDRNDLTRAAARRHPDRFAVIGRFDPLRRGLAGRLRHWRARPGCLGVRVTLHRDPWRAAFMAGALEPYWAAAEAAGLPVMVYPPGLCARIGEVARRHPGLSLVIDHLAIPAEAKGPQAFAELPALLELTRFPNVAVKASALPCHSVKPYPFSDVHGPLGRAFDAFGPDRLFWGSDWTRLPCAYRENLALFTEAVPFFSTTDLRRVMGGAVLDWLGWTA
jgi:predicted TIM-barrel fold metal-dependent hydrolase